MDFFLFFFLITTEKTNKHLSSVYLKVVQRKEGLRLSPLFLYVLNAISASLLRVNNDGVHVFSQHLCHSNLILLLSGLAQVNKTAILKRGRVCLRKGHHEVDQAKRETVLCSGFFTTEPGYSLLMLSMISALRCWRLFSCRSILASPSCSITYKTKVNSHGGNKRNCGTLRVRKLSVKYLVELHVNLINSPLGHFDLLSQLLLHALLLIERLSAENTEEKWLWITCETRQKDIINELQLKIPAGRYIIF